MIIIHLNTEFNSMSSDTIKHNEYEKHNRVNLMNIVALNLAGIGT